MGYDAELADRVREVLQAEDGLGEKKMFGGLAFLVGGHMAVTVNGSEGLMVRCAPDDTDALVERRGASRMVMRGKELDGWLRVTAAAVADDVTLGEWAEVGAAYTRSLPPKQPRT